MYNSNHSLPQEGTFLPENFSHDLSWALLVMVRATYSLYKNSISCCFCLCYMYAILQSGK